MLEDSDKAMHVGQLNFPSWDAFQSAFSDIFDRGFYSNHGPLTAELDRALAAYLNVKHAICVTNGTIALMLVLRSLDLKGNVITPSFTFPATVQSIVWAGLTPVFCDVDPETHVLDARRVEPLVTDSTAAILGVHLWGRPCDPHGLTDLAQRRGLKLVFDAAHATGCRFKGVPIGGLGHAEIFSFHATKILNAAEGGCITTNDDLLAAKLRAARSFHDMGFVTSGLLRMNAKMSEAQAAMALIGLRNIDALIVDNRERYLHYRRLLADVPGLRVIDYGDDGQSNYQYVVAQIDESVFGTSRDRLMNELWNRNIYVRRYFWPATHLCPPFDDTPWSLPVTEQLCETLIQFPSGQGITESDIDKVCRMVRDIRERAI
ncbi:DegT/DnrJ/EryC1/StrS family aminotransferase [Pararobbsia silviterrae]|uniref:Aminotransferase class I/II-fold pyridoxal phosphate-dependent enzyme n=1 Tax=Pararobbsia silviterrae TaxID=1792498 RepID=A0A494X667_9BURK|nr:aminotransferase class I/II-fold pyridoxal phosphate-dependent enzyme [Pararobbsia silviterrae]RKP46185.1 aminotransferase class I/II-fold pyridoxal phosphate-dependent enzyme [Pararobbsia silviterrae]